MAWAAVLFVIAAASIGCGSSEQTSGGGGGVGTGGAGTGGSGGSAAFASVQAIFDQYCVGCHGGARMPGTAAPVPMSLAAGRSYGTLVGVAAQETCGGTRVVAGDPEHSYLYRKVVDAQPCKGQPMPYPGILPAGSHLPDTSAATIRDWIAGGAQR